MQQLRGLGVAAEDPPLSGSTSLYYLLTMKMIKHIIRINGFRNQKLSRMNKSEDGVKRCPKNGFSVRCVM